MKLFVFSDCHGFYDELIEALSEAGFEQNNPEHLLIGCGDYLDRGRKPFHIISHLNSVKNKVLIKGNHESLILECIKRGYPLSHDWHNGTAQTIDDLAFYMDYDRYMGGYGFEDCCEAIEKTVKKFINQMVDYYETENYIFAHSWIPLNCGDDYPKYYTRDREFTKMDDWRTAATNGQWEDARWGNPFEMIEKGLLPDSKTIVFGHWHASKAWADAEGRSEFRDDAKFDTFFGDGWIALDACTVHSGKVNVVVLEDELLKE